MRYFKELLPLIIISVAGLGAIFALSCHFRWQSGTLYPKELIKYKTIEIWTTAYNPNDPRQTDNTPCDTGTHYVCDRTDTIACPREYPKGSYWRMDGKIYECADRKALRFDNEIDINFGDDYDGAMEYGRQLKIVEFLF